MWFGTEHRAVQPRREVRALVVDVRRALPRHRHERHQRPVQQQQAPARDAQGPQGQPQVHQRHHRVTHTDALQHAREAQRLPLLERLVEQIREVRDEDAESDQDERAAHDLPDEWTLRHLRLEAAADRVGDRDPDDPQEEREDQVGRRPAVPRRMLERRVDVPPRSGVVDQDHADDRDAAKRVERGEALPWLGHRASVRSRTIGKCAPSTIAPTGSNGTPRRSGVLASATRVSGAM